MEEVSFLVKDKKGTQALHGGMLVESNPIEKKTINGRSEVCWKEVRSPIKDNFKTRVDEVSIENGLTLKSSPSQLTIELFTPSSRVTIGIQGLIEEGIYSLALSMLLLERLGKVSLLATDEKVEKHSGVSMDYDELANGSWKTVHRLANNYKVKGIYEFHRVLEMYSSQDELARVCNSRSLQKGPKPKGRRKQVMGNNNLVEHSSLDTCLAGTSSFVRMVLREENAVEISRREVDQAHYNIVLTLFFVSLGGSFMLSMSTACSHFTLLSMYIIA